MSTCIRTDKVIRVLLADGWHDVTIGTFTITPYTYLDPRYKDYAGDRHEDGTFPAGFTFTPAWDDGRIAGPMSAILAIQYADK